MPSEREIDALVAEKVMGWTLERYEDGRPAKTPADYADAANNDGWSWHGQPGDSEAYTWKPSTDIAAAWQVVEKMRAEGWSVQLRSNVYDPFWDCDAVRGYASTGIKHSGTAIEPARAICLAALRAKGIEVPDAK